MNWKNALIDYQLYLKIERGLAVNSVEKYGRDIQKLILFLEEHEIKKSPISITDEIIQQFIYEVSKHVNARSQSRIISGLRSFFDYLIEKKWKYCYFL